ncbi:MAG: reactive intermediate/imine deaminase [Deltaproteobacteria bacterium RIFCSPLOWO2_02_FULL_53_8]|nr:MAG: reactive intermediate/imine deaminase [Deltaproteobacteria bacterium RIFCSPLOWO2_02_FULL_53_8]
MKEIKAALAPEPIGPYSQAVKAGGMIFLSGQIPLDPASGELVAGDTALQTRRVLENLAAVLKEAGASMRSVVKTTVFMKDLSRFGEMNKVYGEFFSAPYPARSTVQAAALPKGVDVEIDAIAVVDE